MTTVDNPTPPQTLDHIVGAHLIYTYANGWRYELYVKDSTTIDYRIHSGMVGGRWVRDQPVHLVRLGDERFKMSWDEPTGTTVSVSIDLSARELHGVIFFPRWVAEHPERTICFQNDHLDQIRGYRDAGPTYPAHVIDEFAKITLLERPGPRREDVIACGPADLPPDYADRTN
ncbi:MAG TPA: phenolic acid decarboxylase [Pseudonocardia sp.]|jgi:phenolic acid decarboxylase|uniref:phenolic acid decarboxylase n=1 Tax=Pseudonocardia sp. TaxID=60912 RepID=UPI002CB84637|nr:phenolic acid decarboxylase [Pseudonocardia sp.]HTF54373.1 phenolic acid decarboxylase [Pseudonocardia sp.]